MLNIYDLGFSEIDAFIKSENEPSFRTRQIWEGLYQHHYSSWNEFTSLPKSLRQKFELNHNLSSLAQ